jgi:pimeloyl-ACP methyl ester carboxylesterase
LTILHGLKPWEYEVKKGFILRGYYTPPTGKPLIHFIHANGFCGLTYEHFLSYLQKDFDLFISDTQGHGESDAGDESKGWNASAKIASRVWSHFSDKWKDVPKFALGHSFGAVLTTLMMAKDASLFDGGILLDPVYTTPRIASSMSFLGRLGLLRYMPLSRQARIRTHSWPSFQVAWDYLHQRGIFKGWQDDCLKSYLDHALSADERGVLSLKCPREIEAGIFSSYPHKLWQAIGRIQQPMFMMYGAKTYPFVLDSLPKIHQANLHYDFLELPGGHCFMQEHPQKTAEEIKTKIRMLVLAFASKKGGHY